MCSLQSRRLNGSQWQVSFPGPLGFYRQMVRQSKNVTVHVTTSMQLLFPVVLSAFQPHSFGLALRSVLLGPVSVAPLSYE